MTIKNTQADYVAEDQAGVEEFDTYFFRSPGVEKLYEKPAADMGEILALAIKSGCLVRGVKIVRQTHPGIELVTEKVAVAGVAKLHEKSSKEQGEVLALLWKSKPRVVGLHYVPGDCIALTTMREDSKAGDLSIELTTTRLNR